MVEWIGRLWDWLIDGLEASIKVAIRFACCGRGVVEERRGYITEDSGQRSEYQSGMRRDTQDGKPRYDLIDRDYLYRLATLMYRGSLKYGERNWELASSREELDRFVASALRHTFQWIEGLYLDLDGLDNPDREDHAAAVGFNVAAAEKVKGKVMKCESFGKKPS